jgi:hypothetical protein
MMPPRAAGQVLTFPARTRAKLTAVHASPTVDSGSGGHAGHRHFKEPEDGRRLVSIANAVSSRLQRPIAWVHLPVPRERSDHGFFAPLRDLRLRAETEPYQGVVHLTDGLEGPRTRIAAARESSLQHSGSPRSAALVDVASLADGVAGVAPDPARLVTLWRAKQLEYSFLRALIGPAAYVDFWQVPADALELARLITGMNVTAPRTTGVAPRALGPGAPRGEWGGHDVVRPALEGG